MGFAHRSWTAEKLLWMWSWETRRRRAERPNDRWNTKRMWELWMHEHLHWETTGRPTFQHSQERTVIPTQDWVCVNISVLSVRLVQCAPMSSLFTKGTRDTNKADKIYKCIVSSSSHVDPIKKSSFLKSNRHVSVRLIWLIWLYIIGWI